jgi:DivIVA domain-containing protein
MSLQAKDVDSITFPTAIRGYAEHAVDEFVDQVKTSLGAAEAALAEARAEAAVEAGADADLQQPVPAAARLLQIAQTWPTSSSPRRTPRREAPQGRPCPGRAARHRRGGHQSRGRARRGADPADRACYRVHSAEPRQRAAPSAGRLTH